MSKTIGLSVLGVTSLAFVAITNASDHSNLGMYTPSVSEAKLISNGNILRRDLQFSVPGSESVVAREGSELKQTVPSVVWQFSALLPVNDYIKTAVIHSTSSDEKIRSWQDVQNTFYTGLRVEGALDSDAKIAYAGAYAFSPRWALVQFTEVEEEVTVFPDTILYKVDYIQAQEKGMTLDEYRALALKILQEPESVSLENIRSVVDAADAAKASEGNGPDSTSEIGNAKADPGQSKPDDVLAEAQTDDSLVDGQTASQAETSTDSTSTDSNSEDEQGTIKSGSGDPLKSGGDVNINISGKINSSTIVVSQSGTVAQLTQPVELVPAALAGHAVTLPTEETATWEAADLEEFVLINANQAPTTQPPEPQGLEINLKDYLDDDWVTKPDGSLVLKDIDRL